jgi:Concanavalin A-like lectin/glucanases superfamily
LLQMTGSMTLSAWVKAAANPSDDGEIVAKSDSGSGWQLKTSPDTGSHTFGVRVSGGANALSRRYSTTVRSLNVWYHVAGVYDFAARTLNIYVNGVLDNGALVGTIPASQINSAVNANIGRRSGGFYFNGVIDEVRIYIVR